MKERNFERNIQYFREVSLPDFKLIRSYIVEMLIENNKGLDTIRNNTRYSEGSIIFLLKNDGYRNDKAGYLMISIIKMLGLSDNDIDIALSNRIDPKKKKINDLIQGNNVTIGLLIRNKRKEHALSLTQASSKLGINADTLLRMEVDDYRIDFGELRLLDSVYHFTPPIKAIIKHLITLNLISHLDTPVSLGKENNTDFLERILVSL